MRDRSENEGRHAIVIGASIAGLLAGTFWLTISTASRSSNAISFPKNPNFARPFPRRAIFMCCSCAASGFLRGFSLALRTNSRPPARSIDWAADTWWFNFGAWKPRFPSDLTSQLCSRALLEWIIRRRVAGSAKIRWLAECDVTALLTDAHNARVIGVRLHARGSRSQRLNIQAEAHEESGGVTRGSGGQREWTRFAGCRMAGQLGLSSTAGDPRKLLPGLCLALLSPPKDRQPEWKALVVSATPPYSSRGAVLVPLEGERWLVTLAGAARDYPPTDAAGFLDFARSLPTPVVYEAIQDASPITSIFGYRRTENVRRYYEKLPRFLEGLITLGDAVCAFNPVYGQGMTVAALGASALDACLREQRRLRPAGDLDGLAKRFQKQLSRVVATPWLLATGEDFRYPTTEARRHSWPHASCVRMWIRC